HLLMVFKYTIEPLAALGNLILAKTPGYVLSNDNYWSIGYRVLLYVAFSFMVFGGVRAIFRLGGPLAWPQTSHFLVAFLSALSASAAAGASMGRALSPGSAGPAPPWR